MLIGVPKEIKPNEYRVSMTPGGVGTLVRAGHKILVEKSAGVGSGFSDADFKAAGAKIVSKKRAFLEPGLVVKVKEPLASEYSLLREGQVLFTFLHLAGVPSLAKVMLKRKVTGIAYETVTDSDGSLPLLKPMSHVAGKLAVQIGMNFLEKGGLKLHTSFTENSKSSEIQGGHSNMRIASGGFQGGSGVLIGGVPGVMRGAVVVIGAGTAGLSAAKVAVGLEARLRVLDIDQGKLEYMDDLFGGSVETLMSNNENIEKSVLEADLVIGAVLVPGGKTPILITRDMVKRMKNGSVIVHVDIDQGGCVETRRGKFIDEHVYLDQGVIHVAIPNMPGRVPRTSTPALTNLTFPYVKKLADFGFEKAVLTDPDLLMGVNVHAGSITHEAVARALRGKYIPLTEMIT